MNNARKFVGGAVLLIALAGTTATTRQRAFAPSGSDFPTVGANLANQRYSTLTRITPANVGRLGGAWMTHVKDGTPGSMQATPVVVDGVMYIGSGSGNGVRDRRRHRRDEVEASANGNAGAADESRRRRRRMAKCFRPAAATRSSRSIRRRARSVWTTHGRGGERARQAPPIYYDGLVYTGVSGGESGVRGQFGAYDAKTGKQVWSFYTDSWTGRVRP